MAWLRAALALLAAGALTAAIVSGNSPADPRTPAALPGMAPPFLGTAVVGDGGLTAAIDAYGDVVDLRAPGPVGRSLIDNPAKRQVAGTVPASTGIVPRVSVDGGPPLPLWRAGSVVQRYLPGTGAVRTVARFGRVRLTLTDAARGGRLVRIVDASGPPGAEVTAIARVELEGGARCLEGRRPRGLALVCGAGPGGSAGAIGGAGAATVRTQARRILRDAIAESRGWISRSRPLGSAAPAWARRLYGRSLLTLRALADRRTGAVAAGARDGWAYVWPRDAGAVALALAAAGYRVEARRIARFLLGLDPGAAARFHGDGTPVAGREAQGDAAGWVAAAAQATGLPSPKPESPWRDRADYQEGDAGTYLANAIAAAAETPADGPESHLFRGKSAHRRAVGGITAAFGTSRGLVRRAGDPGSGLDSAAAWAVRPFPRPELFPAARETLLRLAGEQARYGITPGEGWDGGDPWTAPTAWAAWSLAALADRDRRGSRATIARRERRAALRLLRGLRRASTPAGALPERVGARTGIPRSTTPLAWSHAFAILALRQLWPRGGV